MPNGASCSFLNSSLPPLQLRRAQQYWSHCRCSGPRDMAACTAAGDVASRLCCFSGLKTTEDLNTSMQLQRRQDHSCSTWHRCSQFCRLSSREMVFPAGYFYAMISSGCVSIHPAVDNATAANVENRVLTCRCQWSCSLDSQLNVTNTHWSHITSFALPLVHLWNCSHQGVFFPASAACNQITDALIQNSWLLQPFDVFSNKFSGWERYNFLQII